jgi:tetratricopeptide (TPR) repeat protein
MLPPKQMLTIKKGRRALQLLAVILVAGLTACGPPGPRDLRKGERLINAGRYADAVPVLTEAVQLLRGTTPTVQATAWNLLGSAYHGAGQKEQAAHAYLEALRLDRNLWAADFNLGCLYLDDGNYSGAIDYLTTYTSAHQKEAEGYLLLGRARLKLCLEKPMRERDRQIQLDNARLDYDYADKLHPTAEAQNALGIIELQRRIPGTEPVKTSIEYFRQALERDPHYGPALLDLAMVLHHYANEPKEALDTYRRYLSLEPPPPQAPEVEKIAHQLDVDLRITIVPHGPDHPVPAPQPVTNNPPPKQIPTTVTETPAPAPAPAPTPVPVPVPQTPKVAVVQTPVEKPAPKPATKPPVQVLPIPEPQNAPPAQNPTPAVVTQQPPPVVAQPTSTPAPTTPSPELVEPEPKHTFVQKLNPLNWFKSKKPEIEITPEYANIERYNYSLPVTPIPGDRKQAEQLTTAGQQAEHQSNRAEAMRNYQDAIKADPTYFEASLALGLAAIDAKDYSTALDALSQALNLRANSADARYAFAWVLGKKGYYVDAANELSKLLSVHPQETRAHLLLGNYYADNLDQPKLAREQYTKALELIDPQTAQAAILRAWLDQHP